MLADWGQALKAFGQMVPVAAVQAQAALEPAPAESREEAPRI
jgi:hypothetical protein